MSFRAIESDIMIRGTVLASVWHLFPSGIPSVEEYAREAGVAPSTFRRSADWLLGLLPELFSSRKPGQQGEEPEGLDAAEVDERKTALRILEDLRLWLASMRAPTEKNSCYGGEAKQRIKSVADEVYTSGLTYGEIAQVLGLTERQLLRIRREVEEAGGQAPAAGSRRPQNTGELSGKIQELIVRIAQSCDSRERYTPTDIKRILEKNYKRDLLEHHGSETISLSTVSKYLDAPEKELKEDEEHPRGNYSYPEPFQQVAMDTSHFKLYGRVFYLIAVLEIAGRLNLLTRVFLRESTTEVVEVAEEVLGRYPELEVVLMDRGTPYLNDEVREVIESRGKLRLVAPPATPEAKAAAERHFRTLKEAVLPAIERVFPEDPGWSPEQFGKVIQVGVEVFRTLYLHIPQEGIDGLSPWERASSFDPLRAAGKSLELLDRALRSEPPEEYAREMHRRFQLPGEEEDSVKQLRQFGTKALRQVSQEVGPYMGPPHPEWMYDPLGFLAAKARDVAERQRREYLEERLGKEKAKQARADAAAQNREIELAAQESEEHPERFVDGALQTLVLSVSCGLGISRSAEDLKGLLVTLSRKLGHAFSAEVSRLKERIASSANNPELQAKVETKLEEILGRIRSLETVPP